VGSANMDLLSKVPRLPKMGETLVGHSFHMGCGGKGSNQAAMAAKLGAEVTMVVKLGRDPLGEITFKNYQDLGIDTRHVRWDEEHFSGVAPIFVDDEGSNMIVIIPGANMALSPREVNEAGEAIRSADIVICQLEIPIESTLEAFRIAKGAGVLTILNPAPAMPIPDELFQLSDIAAPNEIESEFLTGMPVGTLEEAEEAARVLLSRGPRAIIITLGERGALLSDEKSKVHVPGLKVKTVDTTGAGDAFIGSLAYFLGESRSLQKAVERANVVASMSVTKVGTQASFPTRDEVKHLMAD
jgi:ribokinase